ncbi:conjugative transposon protein TraM [Flavobacterium dauae]|uniref:conjugative transposon protein TraM n=1 Tax=Flavobacterium dauae TaxID=1563479 RepID=UPI00101B3A81|nr:conjugative transposon protein TraM [Flavobacterium dauae]WLD24308.1 conjugative transposon protein TraM [Flavobacterium dauae]
MKKNENKKAAVRVTEGSTQTHEDAAPNQTADKMEKLKKPVIFGLMAIVCAGCMYLIFQPSSDKKEQENTGLNDAVPQATGTGMPDDKGKAYEQELLQRKEQEKQQALATLSDYWNTEADQSVDEFEQEPQNSGFGSGGGTGSSPMYSYRNAQNTLSSFYDDGNSEETAELRRQIEELKEQLETQDVPPPVTVDDQLALMEKSYEMAAKYLPSGNQGQKVTPDSTESTNDKTQNGHFAAFTPAIKNTVSALYREPTDSAFLANWTEERNRGFYTAGTNEQVVQPKNSIKAVVQQTQLVTGESGVQIRLSEPARTPIGTIPTGTILVANAKFQSGRLQLKISSVEFEGNIIPVEITVYDLDGQQGLYVPYSPEMNALSEVAANMSQTGGTSLMMTRSAGQQIAGDLSRGVVQGISGYFSKKVQTPKVTVKAGHQLFLVSKK